MIPLDRLRAEMDASGDQALYISTPMNLRWLTGFSGSSGVALVTQSEALFITDSRYTIQAGNEVTNMPVYSYASPQTLMGFVDEQASKLGIKKMGFEQNLTYSEVEGLKETLNSIEWFAAKNHIPELRKIKSPDEIEKIKQACKLADACLAHVSRVIQVGVTEYDINLEVEFFYRRSGAELAFDPIVVSGPNSAKPHGSASERKLQSGDFFTIDCGGRLNGYNSDITRTWVIGDATARHEEIYNQVLKAEEECCKALEVGKTGIEIDTLARDILAEKDLAQYFGHGLGHGLGLDVHDPGGLSQRSKDTMQAGMVMTVEPGVYIEGFGGVRIEDDVLVTDSGPDILTHYPKELTVVG